MVDTQEKWIEGVTFPPKPAVWMLVQSLTSVDDFLIAEPLKSLADKGGIYTDFLGALWEVRFKFREGSSTEPLIRSLTDWISDSSISVLTRDHLQRLHLSQSPSRRQRHDLFFFLAALAHQNGCLEHGVFIFDDLEGLLDVPAKIRQSRLKELSELVVATRRWSTLDSPVGILVGLSKHKGGRLKKYKFYCDVLNHVLGV